MRTVKVGETTNDIFAFLTINPNAEIGDIHPKAMPVILRAPAEYDGWTSAPTAVASKLQHPLPDGTLTMVAQGGKEDEVSGEDWGIIDLSVIDGIVGGWQ